MQNKYPINYNTKPKFVQQDNQPNSIARVSSATQL
jgi:hypothetical protein